MPNKMPPKTILKTPVQIPKKQNKEIKTYQIDGSGRILGRLATEIANSLRGKNKPQFRPNILIGDKVIIYNASKIKISGRKMTQKLYQRHTGYIGHLKTESMQDVFRKDPGEILRRAVRGMLPKNKLQNKWMKNLIIYNHQPATPEQSGLRWRAGDRDTTKVEE